MPGEPVPYGAEKREVLPGEPVADHDAKSAAVKGEHRLPRRVEHPRARGKRDDDGAPLEFRVIAQKPLASRVADADQQVRAGQRQRVRHLQQQPFAPGVVQGPVDNQHVVHCQDRAGAAGEQRGDVLDAVHDVDGRADLSAERCEAGQMLVDDGQGTGPLLHGVDPGCGEGVAEVLHGAGVHAEVQAHVVRPLRQCRRQLHGVPDDAAPVASSGDVSRHQQVPQRPVGRPSRTLLNGHDVQRPRAKRTSEKVRTMILMSSHSDQCSM